jgi:hypothetical protein
METHSTKTDSIRSEELEKNSTMIKTISYILSEIIAENKQEISKISKTGKI